MLSSVSSASPFGDYRTRVRNIWRGDFWLCDGLCFNDVWDFFNIVLCPFFVRRSVDLHFAISFLCTKWILLIFLLYHRHPVDTDKVKKFFNRNDDRIRQNYLNLLTFVSFVCKYLHTLFHLTAMVEKFLKVGIFKHGYLYDPHAEVCLISFLFPRPCCCCFCPHHNSSFQQCCFSFYWH